MTRHAHQFNKGLSGIDPEMVCVRPQCYVKYKQVYQGWPEALRECPVTKEAAEMIGEQK